MIEMLPLLFFVIYINIFEQKAQTKLNQLFGTIVENSNSCKKILLSTELSSTVLGVLAFGGLTKEKMNFSLSTKEKRNKKV